MKSIEVMVVLFFFFGDIYLQDFIFMLPIILKVLYILRENFDR